MSLPDPVTWGHVLMLLGALAGLVALSQLFVWARNRGHGRGTPRYARARDARRFALWSLLAAAALFAAGCLTGLSGAAIA